LEGCRAITSFPLAARREHLDELLVVPGPVREDQLVELPLGLLHVLKPASRQDQLILKSLEPAYPIRVLLTSNTSQGFEILERAVCDVASDGNMTAHAAYFPFDKPAIMEVAVRSIQPKVMVLLELEIWPGLLSALKRHDSKILIINGRITPKSLRRYLAWPSLWRSLKPDKVLAISENDALHLCSAKNRWK